MSANRSARHRQSHERSQGNARLRERMRVRTEAGESPSRALVCEYLSDVHMDALEAGCPVAALGSDMQRSEAAPRDVSRRRVRGLAALIDACLRPGTPPGLSGAW